MIAPLRRSRKPGLVRDDGRIRRALEIQGQRHTLLPVALDALASQVNCRLFCLDLLQQLVLQRERVDSVEPGEMLLRLGKLNALRAWTAQTMRYCCDVLLHPEQHVHIQITHIGYGEGEGQRPPLPHLQVPTPSSLLIIQKLKELIDVDYGLGLLRPSSSHLSTFIIIHLLHLKFCRKLICHNEYLIKISMLIAVRKGMVLKSLTSKLYPRFVFIVTNTILTYSSLAMRDV